MNGRALARTTFALLLLFLVGLLPAMARLSLSADDVGNAWRVATLSNGFFSPEYWLDPHQNRFPLNAAFWYWLHSRVLPNEAAAHAVCWAMVVGVALSMRAAIARVLAEAGASKPAWPNIAALLFATSGPFFASVADLACSHYMICLFFFFLAIAARSLRSGFWIGAALCGVGALGSEVGVFLAIQYLLLDAALGSGPWLSRRRLLWALAAAVPFLAAKSAIFAFGGSKALFWKAYPPSPRSAPGNVARAFHRVFFPTPAFMPDGALAVLYGAIAGWGAWVWRAARKNANALSSGAGRLRSPALCAAAAVALSLFPFVLFEPAMQFPRLYSELAAILAIWAPLALARAPALTYGLRAPATALVGLMLVNHASFFQRSMAASLRSAAGFEDFRRLAKATALADGPRPASIALVYLAPDLTPLRADWGLPLLLNHPTLRERFLGWRPLAQGAKIAVSYGDSERFCLPEGMAPSSTHLVLFTQEGGAPATKSLCDQDCGACVPAIPVETVRGNLADAASHAWRSPSSNGVASIAPNASRNFAPELQNSIASDSR